MDFVFPQQPLSDPLRPTRFGMRLAPGQQLVRAQDWLVWQAAGQAMACARAEATAITAGAQAAFEVERERGYAEGREAAQAAQAEQMIEQVSRTVDFYGRVEERMTELVMQAVQRIVADFTDRERVVAVVKGALAVVRNQKQVTVRVTPAQIDHVRAALNDLLAAYPGVGYLDIVADARLKPDSCIIESEIGVVEASVNGQLAAMRKAFSTVLGSRA